MNSKVNFIKEQVELLKNRTNFHYTVVHKPYKNTISVVVTNGCKALVLHFTNYWYCPFSEEHEKEEVKTKLKEATIKVFRDTLYAAN